MPNICSRLVGKLIDYDRFIKYYYKIFYYKIFIKFLNSIHIKFKHSINPKEIIK